MARALGTDDSVNTCDCCGKSGLKFTVIIELADGEIAHYGQVCAGRNTGKTKPQITSEIKAYAAAKKAAAIAELRASPEYKALLQKLHDRPRTLVGAAAFEFLREESVAEMTKRRDVAAKYGMQAFELGA